MAFQSPRFHPVSDRSRLALKAVLLASAAFGICHGVAQAQATGTGQAATDTTAKPVDDSTVVVVTGIRATARTSLQAKKDSSTIVDGLMNEEIGALPDLSVGETLERVSGVTADRFKGSASEITVRGLGPFLGYSTFNGREVTNGSGDRTVSFQQFPSELVNGVLVYKAQQADLVEGAVAGLVDLRSSRPLDARKSSFQVDLRGNYQPYDAKINGRSGMGSKGSMSLIHQWNTSIGRVGLTLGFVRDSSTDPEEFYTSSSSFFPCNTINKNPTALTGSSVSKSSPSFNPVTANCAYSSDPAVVAAGDTGPTYFASSNYTWRQDSTSDHRNAVMGTLEWRPNEYWDIAYDFQWSKRDQIENRHDLQLADGRRGIDPLDIAPDGALLKWSGNSNISNIGYIRNRWESYDGSGLNFKWTPTDKLTLTSDFSYSGSHRNEVDLSTRLNTATRVAYTMDSTSDVPSVTFATPVNLNDPTLYTTSAYARRDMEDHQDKIYSFRLDGKYEFASGFFTSLWAGLRSSDHRHTAILNDNNDINTISASATALGASSCAEAFPQKKFFADADTNVTSWAVFDTGCLYKAFTGSNDLGPLADPRNPGNINVREQTNAAYIMGNFASALGEIPYSGNLGVRVVKTDDTSIGLDSAYHATVDTTTGDYTLTPTGAFTTTTVKNSYTEVLPSVNVAFQVAPTLKVRGAIYKAISRPSVEDMGAGVTLTTAASGINPQSVLQAIAGATGGNPRLKPMEAWNEDISVEWYHTRDTAFSIGLYHKDLKAGIVPAQNNNVNETFIVDSTSYTVPVAEEANSDKKSVLNGVELDATQNLSFLPDPFKGFGYIFNLNINSSNFEYADPSIADPANPLSNFTHPGSIIGLSKYSGSFTGYYENGPLSVRAVYKIRSQYLKPNGLAANRYYAGGGFLDMSADYTVNKHLKLRLQALNVLKQPSVSYAPVAQSITQTSYYGTSIFFGAQIKY